MSRSQSTVKIDGDELDGSGGREWRRPPRDRRVERPQRGPPASDPAASRPSPRSGGGELEMAMLSQSSASLGVGGGAARELTPEERALEDTWYKQRQRLVREPIDLIHRALAQREGAASLDALEAQTEARSRS